MSRNGRRYHKQNFRKRNDHRHHTEDLSLESEMIEEKEHPHNEDDLSPIKKRKQINIHVFDGYGTTDHLKISGHLVMDRKLDLADENDSRLKNLVKTSRKFIPKRAEEVWVQTRFHHHVKEALTNAEGRFEVSYDSLKDIPPGVHTVTVELAPRNPVHLDAKPGKGHFIVHPPKSQALGIISDIDDTILLTEAHSKVRMMRNVFLKNYKTQLPIPGMSQLYHDIHQGPAGDGYDATHYVSSSPDNLYSRINQFLSYRGFPEGSINLKHIGLIRGQDSLFDHEKYKLNKIRQILLTYPERQFVLFGDSGEHDPEIYYKISTEFPTQIKAIYIHNVSAAMNSDPRYEGQVLFHSSDEVRLDLEQKSLI